MDFEAYEERAAIMEFDGGLSRFEAETAAAKAQGLQRWEAVNEIRKRNSATARDNGTAAIGQPAHDVSRVQPHAAKENGPMPIGHVSAGRDTGVLPPLRMGDGGVL